MPLREDLLNPVPGENPAGEDLRYNPIYDKIKEARRQDDDLNQGAWQRERKIADYAQVIKLSQDAIATKSKDLQLAAWLTEALLQRESFHGLREGLQLCDSLIKEFWDGLYPEIDDGDLQMRAMPLEWIGTKLGENVKNAPIVGEGYGFYKYKDSRLVIAEDQAKTPEQKKAREKSLKEGKLAPETFDKAVTDTPKLFYATAEKDLDSCLAALVSLDEVCQDKFADSAPSYGKLRSAIEEVRHTVHGFLQKKRETEPDPVEALPPPDTAAAATLTAGATAAGSGAAVAPALAPLGAPTFAFSGIGSSDPADRRELIATIVGAAAALRACDPFSPAPFLMIRGLRWGELRWAAKTGDSSMLEAPPTEIRMLIKRLALEGRWRQLLEEGEKVMALPCSRAWLDLQRFSIEACTALGDEYYVIAIALRSELKTLLRDLPQLLSARLMDDTAAANSETQEWLKQLISEPEHAGPVLKPVPSLATEEPSGPNWQKNFIDSYALAKEALRAGNEQDAFEIMHADIARQRSGRGRFQRKMELVQLCISAGKEDIAQPLIEDLAATVETHKLDEWEDREKVASVLAMIMQDSKRIQASAAEKQKMFERICRLSPVQALSCKV